MKITYEFVTGEVSGVEVDEHLGGMLLDLDRQQDNKDQEGNRAGEEGFRLQVGRQGPGEFETALT